MSENVRPPLVPGENPVDASIICVVTRVRFRSPLALLWTYVDYRRTKRMAQSFQGLLGSAFLVEGWTSCVTMSWWDSEQSIHRFGTVVPFHVSAARHAFRRARTLSDGPEIWSAKWAVVAVSNNLRWGSFRFADALRLKNSDTTGPVRSD